MDYWGMTSTLEPGHEMAPGWMKGGAESPPGSPGPGMANADVGALALPDVEGQLFDAPASGACSGDCGCGGTCGGGCGAGCTDAGAGCNCGGGGAGFGPATNAPWQPPGAELAWLSTGDSGSPFLDRDKLILDGGGGGGKGVAERCCVTCNFYTAFKDKMVCGPAVGANKVFDIEDSLTVMECGRKCPEEPPEKDKCGPDVTDAFLKDMERKLQLTEIGTGDDVLANWIPARLRPRDPRTQAPRDTANASTAKYGLAYKWMNIGTSECGTGKCMGTVEFGGACIPQNELGNMGLAMLFARMVGAETGLDATRSLALRGLFARVHDVVGIRPDSAVAYILGMELYDTVRPSITGYTHQVSGSFTSPHLEREGAMDDWLDSQLSEIGWRDARNRHITLHDAFRTYTKSDVTPKDLTLTSRGVDTGMDCESCGRSVDRLNGDEIFGQLLERYDAERARIGENVGSLDYWLERQVPWAIRRD